MRQTVWTSRLRLIVVAVSAAAIIAGITTELVRLRHAQSPHLPTNVTHRKLGVHTRLADEVERSKIDQSLDMVADMGASWIVELFPWSYYEPTKGRFNWSHADVVVNAAAARHLEIVARLDLVPEWARPANSSSRLLTPAHYEDFADYASQFAARYRGKVDYLVVWNEPNLAFEWGFRAPDPYAYALLLRIVSERVHGVNATVHIVSAGLAPTRENSANAMDDLTYLQRMYDAGARNSFDVLGAHAFGYTHPALDPPSSDTLNFQRLTLLRHVMEANGDQSKFVLVTESGWNDAPRWIHAVSPAQRIAYTLDAFRLADQWSWVQALCIFEFRLPAREDNVNDYFTLVHSDFTPKPIYDLTRQYAHDSRASPMLGAG
jgi:hypothetical protein